MLIKIPHIDSFGPQHGTGILKFYGDKNKDIVKN